ncbi:Biopolymer transport protein ExbD/TolR [Rhodobacteraceae bacterium THAF1]|uniref:biopolymer transporter ExbD n=1 Tax=Palleronia sp. THAF1 TaxID=2587842 RepID=UPI000F40913D|nr:biopolymer transporter ExbD [Palleronia sp. THAF1]QFU08748.1 Biopolymer transport protein ExbD/TolR [Palleronia sp. THAF1]VDC31274.1 Biopolymer transport protein ExbD/TolR [Rhodobacteraceae bacterium THAF1]
MSLTSLIDVIFLLLLFFMLTSTFSRFAEVDLTAAAAGGGASAETPPLFLRLGADSVTLNGKLVDLNVLARVLISEDAAPRSLLVSLGPSVTAQRLTDLLGVLRDAPGIVPTVLGAS